MAIYTDSLEGKLKTLQATWEQFVLDLQASDAFKVIIDLGTKLISLLDVLLNKIPILSDLIKVTLAVGAVGILISSIQKLLSMLGVFTTVSKAITGIKTAATTASGALGVLQSGITAFKTASQTGASASLAFNSALSAMDAASMGASSAIAGVVSAMAPFLAVGAAVGLVAFIGYLNSAEKAAKDAEKAIDKFNDTKDEVDEVQTELTTVNDKIAEINAKDGITLTDKQELQNLKDQREQLEALLKLKKEAAAREGRSAAGDIQKAYTKTYGDTAGQVSDLSGVATGRLQTASAGLGGFSAVLGAYKELTELQKEATANGEQLTKTQQEAFDNATKTIAENQEQLIGWRDSLSAMKEAMSPEEFAPYQGLLDNINTELNAIERTTAPEVWQGHRLTDLLLGDDASSAAQNAKDQLDTLSQQLADGIINEDVYKQKLTNVLTNLANDPTIQQGLKDIFGEDFMQDAGIDEIVNTLAEGFGVTIPSAADSTIYKIDDMKTGLSDLDDRLGNLKSGMEDLGNIDLSSITDMDDMNEALAQGESLINSYENELNGLQSAYDSLGANVDAAGAALDFLASNMDDIINSGEAGYKAISDVISGAGELVDVVDTATGEVINIQDRITAIMEDETLTQQQKQQAVMALQGDIQNAGNNTITTMNAVIDAIVKVKQELASALNAAASFVENVQSSVGNLADKVSGSFGGKVLKAFGIDASDLKTAVSGLSGVADTLRDKSQQITNSIQNDKAELIKGVKEYETKLNSAAGSAEKAYKKVQDAANKAGSSGSNSTKKQTDATKELTDALKEEYEAQKAILDAQKKQLQARKDALNQEKSDLADAKDAIENLIDMTMSMLKQKYQDQLDILEKQQDALDEQKDAFDKKIEQQKEYLKLQKEEQEHTKELSEKNQAIADIQAELEELRYDNSAAGQKKRLELLDSLNDAQKDLTDYQNQYDYDTKVDELDKEKDAFQQQIESQKEAIEQQKEYIKNVIMDEYNLYLEAINLIQGRSEEFKNQLIE